MLNTGDDLNFCSERSGKIARPAGRDCCHRRAGADFYWANSLADWAASGGHYLSWEEHDFLFSAGNFDRGECGAFGFVVFDWAD